MAVIRFDPFRDPLERLLSMAATGTRAPLGMPMDVYRDGDGSYHVEADLPGADPNSVEVTVEHSTLTIRAERSPHYGDSEQVIVAERPQGSFTRQLSLGEGVDSENLTCRLRRWCLHLTIPVSPRSRPPVQITHAPAAAAPLPGAQPGRAGRPPTAQAEHPPGQAGAGRHGIQAGAGLRRAENDVGGRVPGQGCRAGRGPGAGGCPGGPRGAGPGPPGRGPAGGAGPRGRRAGPGRAAGGARSPDRGAGGRPGRASGPRRAGRG